MVASWTPTAIATAITIAGVAAMLFADVSGRRWLEWIGKPSASLAFLALGLYTASGNDAATTQAFIAALAFSVVGDVALMGRTNASFLVGLSAFLLGHVAFVVAFLLRGVALSALALWAVPAAVCAFGAWRWLGPHVEGRMRGPVLVYMAVISTMAVCSLASHAQSPAPVLVVAALAFFISDLAVAREKFVAQTVVNRCWGLPLYFGAQILFASHLLT